jgi:hypothetical protein
MIKHILLLAAALSLGACATSSPLLPKPVDGQADTMRFQVFLNIGATDSAADQRARVDFEDFRIRHGYREAQLIDRRFVDFPAHIDYVVRFAR